MTKSTSRSQVRLIASTSAIFGADEACAMLCISRDAMYRLAPLALTVRACYKVIGGLLSYLQVPGESPGYFFIHSIRSPHWSRSSASSSTSEESTTSLPLFLSYECFNPGIKDLVGAKIVLVD